MDPVHEWDWADVVYFGVTALSVLTAVGIALVVLQFIGERTSRHREFEMMYVQRYWQISDHLPREFVQGLDDFRITRKNRLAFLDYLLLCEDELDLRSRGYITDPTWAIWESGIQSAIDNSQLLNLMGSFSNDRLARLRHAVRTGITDPLEKSTLSKWWFGLR